MRDDDNQREGMFSYISPEKRVPADHPLWPIRKMVDEILKGNVAEVSEVVFRRRASSIAPESKCYTHSAKFTLMFDDRPQYGTIPA